MLLQERSDDPEEILTNLGFGDSNAENPVERIPDRFKDISTSDSVPNIFTDNPEFTQLLQAFTSQQEAAAGNSEPQQATSMEAMMAGHGELSPLIYLSFQAFYLFLKSVPLHYIDFKRLAELLDYAEDNIELSKCLFDYLLQKLQQSLSKNKYEVPQQYVAIKEDQEVEDNQDEIIDELEDREIFRHMSDTEIYRRLSQDLSDGLDVAHNPTIAKLLRPRSLVIGKDLQTLQLASFRSASSDDSPNLKEEKKKLFHDKSET